MMTESVLGRKKGAEAISGSFVSGMVHELSTPFTQRLGILVFSCLAAFLLYKKILCLPALHGATLWPLAVAVALALAGIRVRTNALPRPTRIVLRTILALFGLYLLASYPTLSTDALTRAETLSLGPGRIVAALTAFAACVFPSLGLASLTYVVWYKGFLSRHLGLTISSTDYIPLVEIGLFLILSAMLWAVFRRFSFWNPLREREEDNDPEQLAPMESVFLFALAAHMANYFHSGWKKLFLGEHLWSWALENHTHNLISNGWALGQLPISFSPGLTELSYDMLAKLVVPINLLLLIGQLFALVVLFRIRRTLWATLFYDLTHIVIFICSGIFFYKWIVLNAAIVAALNGMKEKIVPPLLAVSLSLFVLVAPFVFFVAHLGWWDTPALNMERISAVTTDGREIPVPSNFWGSFSVRAAQQRLIWNKSDGFIPTGTYGVVFDQADMRRAEACDYDLPSSDQTDVLDRTTGEDSPLSRFVRSHHRWALGHARTGGNWLYDFYPHHIFSMPWEFREFMTLDLRTVVADRYSIKAACVTRNQGGFGIETLREKSYDIFVAG